MITVSDTRTQKTDVSGGLIRDRLTSHGHRVAAHEIVPDDPERLRERLLAHCENRTIQTVLLTGGTGFSTRDATYEAVRGVLEKELPGFGELFRSISYADVGAAAMLSRAVAGVCQATAVFSMPGSPDAVRLAMDKLILPELGHLVWILGSR